MLRRYNRLLVAIHVVADAFAAATAFLLAYYIRFESSFATVIPVTKGQPPLEHYLMLVPCLALMVPLAFHVQGLYRLRRGRSRVDDFFAVFVGTILAGILGLVALLYYQAYYVNDPATYHEPSRLLLPLFLAINVLLTYASRELVREALERRWKAGIGLKRVLIAGAGDLGRLVADKVLAHRELGFKVVGFIDDR